MRGRTSSQSSPPLPQPSGGTATEDGGLVLEIRLSSSRQLFLELDRHGKADAILFEEEGHSFESLEARDMPGVVRALAERATGPI